MKTSPRGIALIQKFETCELKAYTCPAGVLTIGWGHTGSDVISGLCITRARADELLQQDLARFEREVTKLLVGAMPVISATQSMFDAMVSFAFNCGSAALEKSTLLKKLRAGDKEGAADEFLKWNKAGGKVLAGLTRRRAAERELFLGAA